MIKQIHAVGFEFYLDGVKKAGLENLVSHTDVSSASNC